MPRRLRRSSSTRSAGFTAIEVLIGMSVALISLAGVMAMYVIAARGNEIAAQQHTATTLARTTVEELRRRPIDDIVGDLGAGALPIADEPLDTVEDRGTDYQVLLSMEEVATDPELVRARVRVTWTERGAEPGTGADHEIRLEVVRNRTDLL